MIIEAIRREGGVVTASAAESITFVSTIGDHATRSTRSVLAAAGVLVPVRRGELHVALQGQVVRIDYTVDVTQTLLVAFAISLLLVPLLLALAGVTSGTVLVVSVASWVWLVLGTYLMTRLRFPRFLRAVSRGSPSSPA
jgi:hypothetical protein